MGKDLREDSRIVNDGVWGVSTQEEIATQTQTNTNKNGSEDENDGREREEMVCKFKNIMQKRK